MKRVILTERALGGLDQREDLAIGRLVGEVELRESEGGEVGSDKSRRGEVMEVWKRRMKRRKKKSGRVRCDCRHGSWDLRIREEAE